MDNQFADELEQDLRRGHILEWSELYALDAISDAERARIELYLQESDDSTREAFHTRVRLNRETIACAYATDEIEPPADLFAKIMASLPAVQQDSTQSTDSPDGSPATDDLGERRARRSERRSPVARWLMAAAAAVVIAAAGVTIAQQGSVEQEVLQASDMRSAEITIGAGGSATLAMSRQENAAIVTLTGVPAPPPGSVYQMWRLPADGSAPVSVGTMTAEDVSGTKVTAVENIDSFAGLAITVEPDGGSDTPTMPIIVEIPFEA